MHIKVAISAAHIGAVGIYDPKRIGGRRSAWADRPGVITVQIVGVETFQTPPKVVTLEQAIAYIDDDEMVEVTPKNIRIRKALLDPNDRKKASRKKAA